MWKMGKCEEVKRKKKSVSEVSQQNCTSDEKLQFNRHFTWIQHIPKILVLFIILPADSVISK